MTPPRADKITRPALNDIPAPRIVSNARFMIGSGAVVGQSGLCLASENCPARWRGDTTANVADLVDFNERTIQVTDFR